jgi:hypothetical protein
MKVTIIPKDGFVNVDGFYQILDCSSIPSNIHAIQWDTDHGELEYTATGDGSKFGNTRIEDTGLFQSILDVWTLGKAKYDAEILANMPTKDQLIQISLSNNDRAIQKLLDDKAKDRGYRNINAACAYVSKTSVVPKTHPLFLKCEKFRIEGNALQTWMALTWATLHVYMETNSNPTIEEALSVVPDFTWPD